MMRIRLAHPADLPALAALRQALHPEEASSEIRKEAEEGLARPNSATFVAERDGRVVGFVEVGERAYAEGCSSSPVAFVEEWFVDPAARGVGVGRALIEAAAEWARARGRVEMASYALLANEPGHEAHVAVGFTEVERLVAFRKSL